MEQNPQSSETFDESHPQISVINAFVEITACPSKSQALFFLESHNFELDAAVSTFFDSTDASIPDAVEAAAEDHRIGSPTPEQSRSRSQSQYSPSDSPSPDSVSGSPSPRGRRRPPYGVGSSGHRKARGRFRASNDEDGGSGSDPDFNPLEDANDLGRRMRTRGQTDNANDGITSFNQERQAQPEVRSTKRRRRSSSRSFTGTSRLLSDELSSMPQDPHVADAIQVPLPSSPDPTPPPPPPPPSQGLIVDQSQPTTSIQIRLCDGSRVISRFNNSHTIRDLRAFVDASSSNGPRDYRLQTMDFPPKQLTDLDQTIDESGIANSVLIQRL